MKAISILLLVLVIGCQPSGHSRRSLPETTNQTPPVKTEIPASDVVVVDEEEPQQNSNAHDLVIEIDQVNQILTITGNRGRMCGIDFLVPHKMRYELLSATQAEMTLDGRTFELNRIDDSDPEKIFGDWTADVSNEQYSGQIIFHIRLDPVLKIEAECEEL